MTLSDSSNRGHVDRSESVVIVAGADDNYAMPLAVTLFSALESLNPEVNAEVHVLDGGITGANRTRLEQTLSIAGADIALKWHDLADASLPDAPANGHYTKAMYLRLLAPELLTSQRALYLDSDLLVRRDLSAVWATDLGDHAVAAVRDQGIPTLSEMGPVCTAQNLSPNQPYFNSGVLLMDLERWRALDLTQAVVENLVRHGNQYLLGDQDALNAILQGEWKELSWCWNVTLGSPRWWATPPPLSEVGIVHFTGGYKPWRWYSFRSRSAPFTLAYLESLRRSGWFSRWGYARFRARLVASTAGAIGSRAAVRVTRKARRTFTRLVLR